MTRLMPTIPVPPPPTSPYGHGQFIEGLAAAEYLLRPGDHFISIEDD